MTTATERIPIHEQVRSFIGSSLKMLIDGRWIDAASGKTFPTYDPATGEILTKVAEGSHADMDQAVVAARKAFERGGGDAGSRPRSPAD